MRPELNTPSKPAIIATLAWITAFIAEHGYSPTYREIALGLDLTSPTMAQTYVRVLAAAGLLSVAAGSKARSIRRVAP